MAEANAKYILKTDDGAHISITAKAKCGLLPDQYEAVEANRFVPPESFYFRANIFLETSAAKYKWLNDLVIVGVYGIKNSSTICCRAYMIK